MARYFTRLRLVKYLAISHADSCNKSYIYIYIYAMVSEGCLDEMFIVVCSDTVMQVTYHICMTVQLVFDHCVSCLQHPYLHQEGRNTLTALRDTFKQVVLLIAI